MKKKIVKVGSLVKTKFCIVVEAEYINVSHYCVDSECIFHHRGAWRDNISQSRKRRFSITMVKSPLFEFKLLVMMSVTEKGSSNTKNWRRRNWTPDRTHHLHTHQLSDMSYEGGERSDVRILPNRVL